MQAAEIKVFIELRFFKCLLQPQFFFYHCPIALEAKVFFISSMSHTGCREMSHLWGVIYIYMYIFYVQQCKVWTSSGKFSIGFHFKNAEKQHFNPCFSCLKWRRKPRETPLHAPNAPFNLLVFSSHCLQRAIVLLNGQRRSRCPLQRARKID